MPLQYSYLAENMIKFTINNYSENLDIHFQSVILGLLEI